MNRSIPWMSRRRFDVVLTRFGVSAIEQHHRGDVARAEVIVEEFRSSRFASVAFAALIVDDDQIDAPSPSLVTTSESARSEAQLSIGMSTASNRDCLWSTLFGGSKSSSALAPDCVLVGDDGIDLNRAHAGETWQSVPAAPFSALPFSGSSSCGLGCGPDCCGPNLPLCPPPGIGQRRDRC
jgi:hypothetical protein